MSMKIKPGTFPPWGRWELTDDGRVLFSFRCSCRPNEVISEYLSVHEAGHAIDLLCPYCKRQLVQVRASLLVLPPPRVNETDEGRN